MRVLSWGTCDFGKPRARILRDGLRALGVQVDEIHTDVWRGVEDKSQLSGFLARIGITLRWLAAYPRLLWKLARAPKPDLLLVGYPGALDVLLARPIARWRGIPVAWDAFMSLYDTVVDDRKMLAPRSLRARWLQRLERRAFRCADFAFMDTATHARRMETLFGLPDGSLGAVPVGVEVQHFMRPATEREHIPGAPLKVLFYGQFIPLHGVATIVEAARMLRDQAIDWTLVGRGQDAAKIRAMLDADPLPRLAWIDWVPYDELAGYIAAADLCLGSFGDSAKAASVIPNKVYQALAMGRPILTRESQAIRELLPQSSAPCVRLVPPADAAALAEAVRRHAARLDNAPLGGCHAGIVERIDAQAVARSFLDQVGARLSPADRVVRP
jgi:glycosyltransferase involved in cell wall biosynthesis